MPAYPGCPGIEAVNAAARLVFGARRHDHITPILAILYLMPVCERLTFKTAVLVWKCLHDVAPRYLVDLCVPSTAAIQLVVLSHVLRCMVTVPCMDQEVDWPTQLRCLWPQNLKPTTASPPTARPELSLSSFKCQLKTHLCQH